MANLLKWIKDREHDVADFASRAYDHFNPLDNNRTFQQRTPTNNQSVVQQATQISRNIQQRTPIAAAGRVFQRAPSVYDTVKNLPIVQPLKNPVTRFVDNNVIQPMVGTEGHVGTLLQSHNPYTGSARQQAGQLAEDALNLASVVPIGKAAQAAKSGLTLGSKVATGAMAGAKGGAALGGAYGLSSSMQNESTPGETLKNVAIGAGTGGIVGGAAGAVAPVIPVVSKAAANTARDFNKGLGEKGFAKIPARAEANIKPPTRELAPDAEQATFQQNPLLPENQPQIKGRDAGSIQAELPTVGTRKESDLSKAFRSTRSVIERQGPSGQELGGMLQKGRDTQELFLADVQKRIPTVRSLKGKDFENFVDATQGQAQPNSPKIAQAVSEWQAVHPEIRQRAVNAGLDVGDLGPTYYPHFIDYDRVFKDKNTYNQAINHLVSSGQAATQQDAIQLLGYARDTSRNRQFGNLEASRLVDLPMYDKTPNSLISYLSGSGKRIAHTETFGAKDEKALDLIRKIALEGGDTEAAKNAYDVAVGAKQYNPTASKTSQNIRRYVTTTRLGLGALTNVSQNVNTGIVTGHMRTMASALKQLDPKTRSFVEDTGVIADAVLNDIRTQSGFASFGQRAAGKVVDKITAPLFGTVEKLNRSIAATAGRDYGTRLAQIGDVKTLRRLGVTGDIGRQLTPDQQIQVARKVVEKTQFKVDPQDLPGWTDTPLGKLVSQFRTFSYAQGKFMSNEVLKPAAKGNLQPLARLLAALPLGYALYEAKRKIAGRPEEENKGKIALAAFQNVGGAGIVFDIYQSLNPVGSKYLPPDRRTTMAVGAAGGPAVGVAAQGVGAVSEAIQRKNTPTDDSRLEGKVVAGKNPNDYTDLTSLSRFGLQQVPIVGTPVKNRLLPFAKESNADAGKTNTPGDGKVSTDVKSISDSNKERLKNYKNSLSKDDYAILQLSKKNQEKLVSQGTITQQKLDGLRNYSDNKKKELGYENTSLKTDLIASPDAEYKKAKEKYDQDKKDGKISPVKDIPRQKELKKLEIGSTFDKDVRDLYTLSKQQILDFISSNKDGQTYADKLNEYDQKLYDAGLVKYPKFRKGFAIAKGGGRKSGGRKGRAKGSSKGRVVKVNVAAQVKSSIIPSVGRVRQASFRTGSISSPKFSVPKVRMPQKPGTAFAKLTTTRKMQA